MVLKGNGHLEDFKFAVAGTVLVALATAATSLNGVVRASSVYPAPGQRAAFLPNDVVNLVLGVPLLLVGPASRLRTTAAATAIKYCRFSVDKVGATRQISAKSTKQLYLHQIHERSNSSTLSTANLR